MKKAIWVVAVDNYKPEICKETFPSIEKYAKKIDAEFNVITERRWPSATAPYEKLQVHELGKNNDWNIVIDADMLIDDSMDDITLRLPDYVVGAWMHYDPSFYFPNDDYYFRDGRCIGASFNFLFVPHRCHDALIPFPDDEIESRMASIKSPFMLDEYCLSRNIARYGLKFSGIIEDLDNPPFKHYNVTSGHNSHTPIL